jgi:Cof subfamily protein (haloacid dehalogenase superfamily)
MILFFLSLDTFYFFLFTYHMKLPIFRLEPRMIALDLDDTLLKADLTISDHTVQTLQSCAKKNIYITLCSGRTENGMLDFVRRLDIAGTEAGRYMITFNGSEIFDLHTRQSIYTELVPGDILVEAHRRAVAHGLFSQVYDPSTIYAPCDNKWAQRDISLSHLKLSIVPDFEHFLSEGHRKMIIPGDPELLQTVQSELKAVFGPRAAIFISKPYFLEILPADCGKGEALSWLCKKLSIPIENLMAFGDSMNDETMIRTAGYSVAMRNGLEAIQNEAKFVTRKTNEDDGVADFVDSFVL